VKSIEKKNWNHGFRGKKQEGRERKRSEPGRSWILLIRSIKATNSKFEGKNGQEKGAT